MDRLSEYSGVISLPWIAVFVCSAGILFQMVPSRLRLEATLASMVAVLTIGRLPEIGLVADVAKVTSGFMFLFVALAAVQRPGRKMRIPGICWAYPVVAVATILCVVDAADRTYALAIRTQWLVLVLSALLTVRVIVSEQVLKRVLAALFVGMTISCLITVTALLFEPGGAVQNAFGRFMPYGCNPNLIGVMYAATVGLGMYFSLTTRPSIEKTFSIACTVLAAILSLLTVSRGAFLVIGLTTLPLSFRAMRRPMFAIVTMGVLAALLYSLLGFVESCDFDRLGTDVSRRTPLDVVEEIRLRPYWGVGFTQGLNAYDPELHAHNAYVTMLYLGGFVTSLPLFALQLYGQFCMARTWQRRYQLPIDPLLIGVLAGFSVALSVHGFVNEVVYHPTYTMAFLNVLVPCLFITLNRCCRGAHAAQATPVRAARFRPCHVVAAHRAAT